MLSIIIINYNGKHLLRQCLDSVRVHSPENSEIIVHDNSSSDGSIDFLEQNFPDILISKSNDNLGFVGGNNAAAKLASGTHLLLLNSDTIVQSDFQPMLDLLVSDSTIWAVGCRLVYGDETQQESIGQRLGPVRLALSWTPLAQIFRIFRRTLPRNSPLYAAEIVDCDWVSGACLLTTRDCWNKLSGLDERYFMYMEDVDYCERVHNAGGRVCYTGATLVTHLEGAGRPWIGRRALLNTAKSYVIYVGKFYGAIDLLLLRSLLPPVWWLRGLGHALMHLFGKDPHGREKASAYFRAGVIVISSRYRD